jgi:flavin-dependent dehydrogenase
VTGRARAAAPCSIDDVVEAVVTEAELRSVDGRRVRRTGRSPLVYMTQRWRLDHHLATQAAAAGADFRDGARCSGIEVDRDGATLSADGERVRARIVIGADGANGTAASQLGLGGNRALMLALEGHLDIELAPPALREGRLVLESGSIRGGYAWSFPKADHLNIGIGGWIDEGPELRVQLAAFCGRLGVEPELLEPLRGHRLPLRAFRSRLASSNACVVGDAAGLVDPLTGDGIYESFLSGRLAAEACAERLAGDEQALIRYGKAMTRALAPQFASSWVLKHAFDRIPRLTYELAVTRLVWRLLSTNVAGGAHPQRIEHAHPAVFVEAPTRSQA